MPTTFTDYKLALGVKNNDKDYELYSSLRGLIRELYSVWGICITKDTLQATETINTTFDTITSLSYRNIVDLSITGYEEGVDFSVDKSEGTITILSTGTMLENTDYAVGYSYYIFMNESNEINYEIYPQAGELLYHIDIKPINKLHKVTYDGNTLIEGVDYYFYNNKLELTSNPTNVRTPIVLDLDIGFESMPEDLRQTFYELNNIRIDYRENKAYIIGKVNETVTGTTTTFKYDLTTLPPQLKEVLLAYTGRRLASV